MSRTLWYCRACRARVVEQVHEDRAPFYFPERQARDGSWKAAGLGTQSAERAHDKVCRGRSQEEGWGDFTFRYRN